MYYGSTKWNSFLGGVLQNECSDIHVYRVNPTEE